MVAGASGSAAADGVSRFREVGASPEGTDQGMLSGVDESRKIRTFVGKIHSNSGREGAWASDGEYICARVGQYERAMGRCTIYIPQLSQGDESVLAGVTEREVTSTEAVSSGLDQADVDGTAACAPGEGGRRSRNHTSRSLNVAAAGCPYMLTDDGYWSWRGSAAT
jgi:hypothetical protein